MDYDLFLLCNLIFNSYTVLSLFFFNLVRDQISCVGSPKSVEIRSSVLGSALPSVEANSSQLSSDV